MKKLSSFWNRPITWGDSIIVSVIMSIISLVFTLKGFYDLGYWPFVRGLSDNSDDLCESDQETREDEA